MQQLKPHRSMHYRHGFSLIEMAVVIGVIGLIVGAVISGNHVLQASRLQSVMTDFAAYKEAIQNFESKYETYPGDMFDAQDYWGALGSCPNGDGTGLQATCNGDGDGRIGEAGGLQEMHRAWQHLSNAEMVRGAFSGMRGSAGNNSHIIPGTNAPLSEIKGAGFGVFWPAGNDGIIGAADGNYYEGTYKNILQFGRANGTGVNSGAALNPRQADQVDNKMDDGIPGTGLIRSRENLTDCASAGAYEVDTNTEECALIYILGF